MLACTALVGCTNEEVLENNEIENGGAQVPAYVSLSISAGNVDSRGNTELPNQAEDTGITNAGTEAENAVTSLAVVILNGESVEESAVFSGEDFTSAFELNQETNTWNQTEEDTYFRVTAGEKKVIVVLNPSTELAALEGEALYNGMINGKVGKGTTLAETLAKVTSASTKAEDVTTYTRGFMMANREITSVTCTEANTINNPATANVSVERAVAKIMYRPFNDTNTYDLTVETSKSLIVTEIVNSVTYYKATDKAGKEVWYTLNGETIDKVYGLTESNNTYTATELQAWNGQGLTPTTPYYTGTTSDLTPVRAIYTEDNPLSVKLEGYIISNLTNDAYNVRHIGENAFGVLNGSNFLYDPYFAYKNAANLSDVNYFSTIFFTPFSGTNGIATRPETGWISLPTTVDTEDATTTGSATYVKQELQKVGNFMTYAFENATAVDMQKHGYSTSITFKATATYKAGNNAKFTGYTYKNAIYKTWEDLQGANPEIGTYPTATQEGKTIDEQLTELGIAEYRDGVCYYTTQIKHFDNNLPNVMGNMEFAIVRNNIYSLQVSTLSNLGDAIIDNNPDVDNEKGEGYINLAVKIMPWVVRYNQIEF